MVVATKGVDGKFDMSVLMNHKISYICPDCRQPGDLAQSSQCMHCNWAYETVESIPILLSTTDKENPLFKSYISNYDQIAEDDLNNSIQPELYLEIQRDKLLSYIGSVARLSLCEVGIGKGYLMESLLQQKPAQITGVDISLTLLKKFVHLQNANVSVVMANAENLPFHQDFDLVIASDILEHVFNPGDFLYCVNKALKPRGKFVVRVPYNENLNMYSKLQGCPYQFAHLRNFSTKTLRTLLEPAGFQVEKFHYDGYWDYKTWPYLKRNKYLYSYIRAFYKKCFPREYAIAGINNYLGRLLMEPAEITAVCYKYRELP